MLPILSLIIFIPLVRWPYSPFTPDLPWDAGLYHFPKAVEMIVTGSARDLTIAYGEYPFGYETLVALTLSLNHAGLLLGSLHALITLLLFLSLAVLITRLTRLPRGLAYFGIALVFLSYQLARNFDSNIWWSLWAQVTRVGKNDVLLGAALLAALCFTPHSKDGPLYPLPLAMASAIAISVKPNSALILLFAWLILLYFLWRSAQLRGHLRQLIGSGLIILPGLAWVFRNLAEEGTIMSPASMIISNRSIAANLTNPYLYQHIPNHLYYIAGILVVAALVSIFRPSMRLPALTGWLLLISFALTPASAFLASTQALPEIEWRFAIALLGYMLVLLLVLLEPLILPVYAWVTKRGWTAISLAAIITGVSLGILWTQKDFWGTYPEKAFVLHDQYSEPVGVDGYCSAYDYVQKNVHNSVVIIENGLPYYLYDRGFTNSVTRSRPEDYIVYLQTNWLGEGGYPESLSQPEWSDKWQLVYEDPEGRVYKRK